MVDSVTNFSNIFKTLTAKNFVFSLGRSGAVATRDGRRVKAEQLAAFVEGAGWEDGVSAFLDAVATHLRSEASPGVMRSDSVETKLNSPLIAARCTYGELDRPILAPIRLVRTQGGSMVLVATGQWDIQTYTMVQGGDAADLRRVLTHVPASPSYLEDHPEASRLEELTMHLIAWCNALTLEVQGAEPAVAIAANVVSQKCPYSLIKSGLLSFWTHTEGDGTISHKLADGFTLAGDWADVIAAQMDSLWACRWLYMAAPPVLTNQKGVPALHYIDLEGLDQVQGDTSAWDTFLRKMSHEEGDVFKAFIWSIFDAKNRGRQLLYLMDEGYSGKSAVLAAIHHALGEDLCFALSKESLNNQFAMSKIWDKRLVTNGDCKNAKLIRSQAMHSILGGDLVDVEYKGKDSFSYRLGCKVIVASNVMLEIDASARNEYTRLLPIKINFSPEQMVKEGVIVGDKDGNPVLDVFGRPKFIGDQKWPELLKQQFWAFLATCKEPYERLCPTHTDIILPDSCVETTASFDEDSSDILCVLLEKFLTITGSEEDFVRNADMYKAFQEILAEENLSEKTITYAAFKEYLRRRHHIELKQRKKFNKVPGFVGVVLKDRCPVHFTNPL